MGVVRDNLSAFRTLTPYNARQSARARLWRAFTQFVRIDATKAA